MSTTTGSTHTLKQGDRSPIGARLIEADGTPANLTGRTVRIHIRRRNTGPVLIDALATIAAALTGDVTWTPGVGETETLAGLYDVEWETTLADGRQITYPNRGYDTLRVDADLA